MNLLILLLGCAEPILAPKPTEARFKRFCRAETVAEVKEAEALNTSYVEEVLLKDGWAYAGPVYNDGLNCTVTLWTR